MIDHDETPNTAPESTDINENRMHDVEDVDNEGEDDDDGDDENQSTKPEKQHTGNVDDDVDIDKEEARAKCELYIMIGIAIVVVIAVVILVSVVAVKNKPTPAPTAPPPVIVMNDPQTELNYLQQVLQENSVITELSTGLPTSAGALTGIFNDEKQPPQVRAASWVLQAGPIYNNEYNLIRRFALATIYYANGGSNWVNQTNWLTNSNDASHCDWYGVICCSDQYMMAAPVCCGVDRANYTDNVIQLSLNQNNLNGQISTVVNLLKELVVIDFSFNSMTGSIPGSAIGNIPQIGILYLQHNQLTGTVPVALLGTNQSLSKSIFEKKQVDGSLDDRLTFLIFLRDF